MITAEFTLMYMYCDVLISPVLLAISIIARSYFFQEYGDVEYVNILRDKSTNESKGLAYVKFHRPYHAALALENCDPCKYSDTCHGIEHITRSQTS